MRGDAKGMRARTKRVCIGGLAVGGGARVSVQSMTKSDPLDGAALVREIRRLGREGCELVRLAVPTAASLHTAKAALERVRIPAMADIHFRWELAMKAMDAGFDAITVCNRSARMPRPVRKEKDNG